MNAARQIVRWSIPGALLLLFCAGSQFVLELSWGVPREQIFKNIEAPAVLLGAAATIPIGFMLWVIYYVTYQPVRFRLLNRLTFTAPIVADDRGGRVLSSLSRDRENFDRLAKSFGITDWGLVVEKVENDESSITRSQRSVYKYSEPHLDATTGQTSQRLLFTISELSGRPGRALKVFHLLQLTPAGIDEPPQLFSWLKKDHFDGPLRQRFLICRAKRADYRSATNRALSAYSRFNHKNWAFVNALVCDLNDVDISGRLKREYDTSLDMYHALGTVRISATAAAIITFAYDILARRADLLNSPLRSTAALAAIFLSLTLVGILAHLNRRDTLVGIEHFLTMSLFHATLPDRQGHADPQRGLPVASQQPGSEPD